MEEIEAALAGIDRPNAHTGGPPAAFAEPNLNALRSSLKGTIHSTMRKCYESVLAATPLAPGTIPQQFATSVLLAGYSNDRPWLLEFAHDGQVNWHTDFGFYAVGSGGSFARVAHGLMAHYLTSEISLKQGLKVAYRAIETTCEVSPGGVGMPVRIAVVDETGPRALEEAEVNEIGDLVARWKTLETETLSMSPEDAKMQAEGDLPSIENTSKSASAQ